MKRKTASPSSTLPPNLERYLPPKLWRKLTKDVPGGRVLFDALNHLSSVLYLLSTYIPRHLCQEKMRHPEPGLVHGQLLGGSLLFSDVSGFTALSERLANQGQEGIECLTEKLNDYFDRMIEILAWSDGVLLKFAGDALLVYFEEQEGDEQAHWAVRAGQRMIQAMADFAAIETPMGTVALKMKIGISTGPFCAASVGSAKRMEYVIFGDTVAQVMAAEGAAEAGLIVVDEATAAVLDASVCVKQAPGFYAVEQAPDEDVGHFEIKARTPRRARSTGSLIIGLKEIIAEMETVLRQIEVLSPYLSTELVERVVARAEQRQLESEYRPTTVIFANLTGFETFLSAWVSSASDSEGVERVTRMLSDYFNAVRQVIDKYGGIISRIDPYSRGSKLFVLFGAPVAHEDDPQRAVSAALAMNTELATLNKRWRRTLAAHLPPGLDGPLIQQRIGITHGVIFAGQCGSATRREYTVMGDDVNLAARLMSIAQPSQILISQRVYEVVAHHFVVTDLPPVRVKGKSKPITIYQVDGLRGDRLTRRLQSRGPLLGRDAELKQGREALRQALAGQAMFLTIRGPAGVGKSSLADALSAEALEQGAKVLLSECASYTAEAPYVPWVALVHAIAGIGPADPPNVRSEKLLRLLSDIGLDKGSHTGPLFNLLGLKNPVPPKVLWQPAETHATEARPQARQKPKADLFARLGQKVADRKETTDQRKNGPNLWQLAQKRHEVQTGQQTWQRLEARVAAREQTRLSEAIRGLLERLSVDTPLLLFLENAQWMDSTSRALLNHLSERLKSRPIMVLVVQRDEDAPLLAERTGEKTTEGTSGGQILTLGPLNPEGTSAIVGHLLGEAAAQTDITALARAIHEQSRGNPLFIEETVRWLQRTGQDSPDDLKAGLRASSTLKELVLSHLDSLPYVQRNTGKVASVVGDDFAVSDLRSLLAGSPQKTEKDVEINDSLSGLEEARLTILIEPGTDARYAFRQTLVRELVYDSQPFALRRELHKQVAATLESRYADAPDFQAELLAHHYELAEEWLPAARYLLLCGHKARRRHAYPQAENYYSRAMAALERIPDGEATPETVSLKAQAHEGQGDVALLTGDFAAAVDAYDAAQSTLCGSAVTELPTAWGTCEVESRLLVKHALVLPTQGKIAEAETCARQAWAAHPDEDDPSRPGLAAAATLAWLLWRASAAEASDWIERAAALAAPGADRWMAGVAVLLNDLAGKWASVQQGYQALDQPVGAALAAVRLGDQRLGQGEADEALALYDQAAEIWTRESDAHGLALVYYRQAEVHWRKSDASTARDKLQEALTLLGSGGSSVQNDRIVIQAALEAVDAGQPGAWQPWHWQRYDDKFRISMLFQP